MVGRIAHGAGSAWSRRGRTRSTAIRIFVTGFILLVDTVIVMSILAHTKLAGRRVAPVLVVLVAVVATGCGGVETARGIDFQREGADEPTSNPFMEGIDTAPVTQTLGDPVADTATSAAPTARRDVVSIEDASSDTFSGDTPGLYGGTRDNAVCDATKMAAFLRDNPEKASAWAEVLGIGTGDIDEYIALLTPVTLRVDTAVTNHGFVNGRATSIPTVLQAGTTVFVDDRGAPVVKCSCGNPLTAPPSRENATFSGVSWAEFSSDSVVVVNNAPEPLNDLALVDPVDTNAFTRPVGTDGDADVTYVPGPEDLSAGEDADTTTTAANETGGTMPGGSATATSTSQLAADGSATSTTGPPDPDDVVIYNAEGNGTGGVCAGVPGAAFELKIIGGHTIVFFSGVEEGPIAPDGSFDFRVNGTIGGGGTLVGHFTGQVDQGPPYRMLATREDTITSPTGMVTTCISSYTGVRRDLPADATSTTSTTSTTLEPLTTTTISEDLLQPLEQTWYFIGRTNRFDAVGCDRLGITVTGEDPPQRIRVRDVLGEGRTVTFLGRPSRTFDVAPDGRFGGQFLAAGEGDPDQVAVTVSGGPVPSLGDTASAFNYRRTISGPSCFFDMVADPS